MAVVYGPVEAAIRRARERITDMAHWTQRALARNEQGRECDPRSPLAVQWCHNGAMIVEAGVILDYFTLRTAPGQFGHENMARMEQAYAENVRLPRGKTLNQYIVKLNNGRNRQRAHKAVLRLMDRAADYAHQQGW